MSVVIRAVVIGMLSCGALTAWAPEASAQSTKGINQKAWVTTTDGREQEVRITSLTGTSVLFRLPDGQMSSTPLRDVMRIEVPDGVGNGARKGAIVMGIYGVIGAVALGTSCDRNCAGITPFLVASIPINAAFGAGFGAFIDALRVKRETLYSASGPSPIAISPMLTPHSAGLHVSVQWGSARR